MQIHTKKIYTHSPRVFAFKNIPLRVKAALSTSILLCSTAVVTTEPAQGPVTQDFVLTAYYSPLEGQCCYVKGGVLADRILNGDGHTTADGTPVYAGVIAAPGTYPFGTIIDLPGYGVFKVHDRGGAIQEWDNGKHRLDLWVGFGEEGLARALQLGLKDLTGTIYYPGTPAPKVSFDFNSISAPNYQLERFLVYDNLMVLEPSENQSGLSVKMLQDILHILGYLQVEPTGYFGEETVSALQRFIVDFRLEEPSTKLTSNTAAHLLAALARKDASVPISEFIREGASEKSVSEAQRILRSIGYYSGRINGKYSDELQKSILKFQQDNNLVGTANDPGAGQIGPVTTVSLQAAWNRMLVSKRAKNNTFYNTVEKTLKEQGKTVESFLSEGNAGTQVERLQTLLAEMGYFDASEINGNFGPMTKQAVVQYQIDNNIINSASAASAGIVGPKTLVHIQRSQGIKTYELVRSHGLEAL